MTFQTGQTKWDGGSSIQRFWSSNFILPKKVIKTLEQNFNHFLWQGQVTGKGKTKVAWEKVCLPKREGGLGLQRVASWNRAAIMKHIWSLFTKVGSLWVAWIHANLLKGKCFWTIKIPQECTWSWRAILKLRDEVRKFIRFEVGDGKTIFLWHVLWHLVEVLIQRFGSCVIYDAASNPKTKVDSLLKDKTWIWRPARSDALVTI